MENLLVLWAEADLAEGRNLLMVMLDEVYVGTVDEKAIVTIRPKPAPAVIRNRHHPRGQWNCPNKPDAPDSK